MMAPSRNVFLFLPNLIGYARIILAFVAFIYMMRNPWIASVCYFLSAFLDAFDGWAARLLDQGSKFGAMLDQLTDRCVCLCLLFNLALLYPEQLVWFQLWAALDIASHWLHVHVANISGAPSHKSIGAGGNPVLRLYYTSRPVLFTMCAATEGFFCCLYVLKWLPAGAAADAVRLLMYACAPLAAAKTAISVVHLVTASRKLAALDATATPASHVD